MKAVGLHHSGRKRDGFQKKGFEGQTVAARKIAEELFEALRISWAVIRRDLHAEQQHPSTRSLRGFDDAFEVAPGGFEGQCPKTVVPAQFYDDDLRAVYGQGTR